MDAITAGRVLLRRTFPVLSALADPTPTANADTQSQPQSQSHRGTMSPMNLVFGFSHHTGIRLAELGFLFLLFAGVWLAAGLLFRVRYDVRAVVAGVAIAVGSVLLVIAAHWGHFG